MNKPNKSTKPKVVSWSVVNFPIELRRCFVGEARTRNLTTNALLEEILLDWMKKPKKPKDLIVVEEGGVGLWNAGAIPLDLKNKFVGLAYKYDLNVATLLTTILMNWLLQEQKKEKATA